MDLNRHPLFAAFSRLSAIRGQESGSASIIRLRGTRDGAGKKEHHHSGRLGWLRTAVLGANDGILSTSSLVLGVAAAHVTHRNLLVAGMAGLVAGRCRWPPVSMFRSIHKKTPNMRTWILSAGN